MTLSACGGLTDGPGAGTRDRPVVSLPGPPVVVGPSAEAGGTDGPGDPDAPVLALADVGDGPARIALDGDHVVWASTVDVPLADRQDADDFSRIVVGRVAQRGGRPRILARLRGYAFDELVTSRGGIYLRDGRDVLRVDRDSGRVDTVATDAVHLAANDEAAYWLACEPPAATRGTLVREAGDGTRTTLAVTSRREIGFGPGRLAASTDGVALDESVPTSTGAWTSVVREWNANLLGDARELVLADRAGSPTMRATDADLWFSWPGGAIDRVDRVSFTRAESTRLSVPPEKVTLPFSTPFAESFAVAPGAFYFLAATDTGRLEHFTYSLFASTSVGGRPSRVGGDARAGERLGPSIELGAKHLFWIRREESERDVHGILERRTR
ncbi:MAG: hypothetical protein U0169_06760 [Polyangiaceae bacterium]